jgi:diguanylate cyclase (GGDEF)-like protein/PAS domain S-box-containing protein
MIRSMSSRSRLSLMFWGLIVLGLLASVSMAGFVAWHLGRLGDENALAQAKRQELQLEFALLQQLSFQAHAAIALMLSEESASIVGQNPVVTGNREIQKLSAGISDQETLKVLAELSNQFNEMEAIWNDVVDWHQSFTVVSEDVKNAITLSAVREELGRLKETADILEGQHNLKGAVLLRQWKKAEGEDFITLAKQIREEQSRRWPRALKAVKDELAEQSRLVEQLVAELQADKLIDIRDNQLKPSFERLTGSLGILSRAMGEDSVPVGDAVHLAELLFGRGYRFDLANQAVVIGDGGLFHLQRHHHQLTKQWRNLINNFRQHEKRDAPIFEALARLESLYVASLGGEAEHRLRDALNKMLLWVVVILALIVPLVWLIFRNIRTQFQQQGFLRRQNESILNSAREGIVGLDAKGCHLFVNPAAALMLGAQAGELNGRNNRDFWSVGEHVLEEILSAEKETGRSDIAEFKRLDGKRFPVEFSVMPMRQAQGVSGAVLIFRDITESQRIEKALQESESKFRGLSEQSLVGIYVIQDGIFAYVNPCLAQIFGYERNELEGKLGPQQLTHPDDWQMVDENLTSRLVGDSSAINYSIRGIRKDGEMIHLELLGSASIYKGRPAVIGTLLDTSLRKEAEEKVKYQAYYDQLTGLPNRRLFNDRLDHALKNAQRGLQRIALLFLDLDRFKKVNDSLGHPVGDGLLQKVSSRVEKVIRENDTLARLGGDEFAIVLEHIEGPETAAFVARKVLNSFEKPFDVQGHNLFMGTTVGICIYPDDGQDADALIKHADAAMYQAKRWGRATYAFYKPEMTTYATEWLALETALRSAIKHSQLLLHFQPQVDLRNGAIVGAEALVRWQHPERGLISPDVFIPLAEESGMILDIGDWVLNEACRLLKSWQQNELKLGKMAVNLSGIQVVRGNILQGVKKILDKTKIEASCLELEITENSIMEHTDEVLKTLHGLRQLGVSLAIDDFGTGYSSLNYLKQLPIDKLKIDRSFVMDIPDDANDVAITKAVISLAKVLGLDLVAEGVETATQSAFLLDNGCTTGQGYLFSPPVPPEVFCEYLRENKRWSDAVASA